MYFLSPVNNVASCNSVYLNKYLFIILVAYFCCNKCVAVCLWLKSTFFQAYISDFNIFFKSNVSADEAVQLTHNGKKNEILNGVPDWVYEGK